MIEYLLFLSLSCNGRLLLEETSMRFDVRKHKPVTFPELFRGRHQTALLLLLPPPVSPALTTSEAWEEG